MSDAGSVELVESFPDAPTYRRLRIETGLSPKSQEAAERGLANTLYGVSVVKAGEVIGMRRLDRERFQAGLAVGDVRYGGRNCKLLIVRDLSEPERIREALETSNRELQAMAGRFTPGSLRSRSIDTAISAPVLPQDTATVASPFLTASMVENIEVPCP